jgi:hypothetical protein
MNDIGGKMLAMGTSIGLSFFLFAAMAIAQSSQPNPEELARRVVQNELRAEGQDDSHWMYRLETAGNNGQEEVDEVVETKSGDLKHPMLLDGRELTAKERKESDARLGHNPQALRDTLKEKNQDAARSQQRSKRCQMPSSSATVNVAAIWCN